MPTFRKIATVTGNGSASELTFTNIPQTFTDLVIRGSAQSQNNADSVVNVVLRRQTDPGGVPYRGTFIVRGQIQNGTPYWVGSPMGAGGFAIGDAPSTWTTWNLATLTGALEVYIHNYSQSLLIGFNSNIGFTQSALNNRAMRSTGGIFFNGGAITGLTIAAQSQVFSTNTRFDLYGISNT